MKYRHGFDIFLDYFWIFAVYMISVTQSTNNTLNCSPSLPNEILQVCETAPKAEKFHYCRIVEKRCQVNRRENNVTKMYLEIAPCPPPWNLSLICTTGEKLSCSERKYIFERCTKRYKYPTDLQNVCNTFTECAACSEILSMIFFKKIPQTNCVDTIVTTEKHKITINSHITFSTKVSTNDRRISKTLNVQPTFNMPETSSIKNFHPTINFKSANPTSSIVTQSTVQKTIDTKDYTTTIAAILSVVYAGTVIVIFIVYLRKKNGEMAVTKRRIKKVKKYRDEDPENEMFGEMNPSQTQTAHHSNYPNRQMSIDSTASTAPLLTKQHDNDASGDIFDIQEEVIHETMPLTLTGSNTHSSAKNQDMIPENETLVDRGIPTRTLANYSDAAAHKLQHGTVQEEVSIALTNDRDSNTNSNNGGIMNQTDEVSGEEETAFD